MAVDFIVDFAPNVWVGSVIAVQWGLAAEHLDVAVQEAGTGHFRTFPAITNVMGYTSREPTAIRAWEYAARLRHITIFVRKRNISDRRYFEESIVTR